MPAGVGVPSRDEMVEHQRGAGCLVADQSPESRWADEVAPATPTPVSRAVRGSLPRCSGNVGLLDLSHMRRVSADAFMRARSPPVHTVQRVEPDREPLAHVAPGTPVSGARRLP